jgi:carbon-monoxide dehydrogenase catalytic subunit
VQDVFPAIMDVARCTRTTVVTTSDAARLPGAEHYAYDHHHANIGDTEAIARKIVTRAIESHRARQGVPVSIPAHEVTAEVGFTAEYIKERYQGFTALYQALAAGRIKGIVNLVGCNNPRVVYEKAVIDVTDVLLKNNILILTNGCASFPLLKLGYCTPAAREKAGIALRGFLDDDLPPVWHMGECIDNARASTVFGGIAQVAGKAIKDMPFAFASPEWSNEKGLDAALAFRLFGISSYHCVEPPAQGSSKVMAFLKHDTEKLFGAAMHVIVEPEKLAAKIIADVEAKRRALGWQA